jgi:hypothetical protein
MSAPPGEGGTNPLLSGLFGTLQSAASQRLSTASVWQTLRVAAGTWQHQASGGGETPSLAQLEEAGRAVLSQAGVGIQQVNAYRGVAGQWLAAKQRLHAADSAAQVQGNQIFTPPWATTAGPDQQSRFRVRVNWTITPTAGDVFNKWSTYEMTAPVTSIDDVLGQAAAKAAGDKYLSLLSGGAEPAVADYEIEQV